MHNENQYIFIIQDSVKGYRKFDSGLHWSNMFIDLTERKVVYPMSIYSNEKDYLNLCEIV